MKPPPTLIEVLEHRLRLEPDAPTFDGGTLANLRDDALRIAIGLRERGWADQPVLIAAPAGLGYVKCLLGCLYAGAIAVPAYPITPVRLTRAYQRLASIVEDAGIRRVLIADPDSLSTYDTFETLALPQLLARPAPAFDWELAADRVCLLQYTSGSTSTPRGVVVTLRQLSANLAAICEATRATNRDVAVTWLPPYHDMGLIGGIFAALYAGVPTYVLSPDAFVRRPITWLQTIAERRATITMAPNFAFDFCVRRIPEAHRAGLDLSSLRVVFVGAEPIHPGTLDAFAGAFAPQGFDRRAFYPCYGLAEATLFVTGGDPDAAPKVADFDRSALEANLARAASGAAERTRLVSCGRPSRDTEIRIVEPDTGETLGDGQVGEIWVSGPSVATGYWNKPEDTRACFEAQPAASGHKPFLRTGDLGFVESNELFVTGRLKDLIIVRGQNHYPQDIERSLRAVHPALASVTGAVFSITSNGEELLIAVHEVDQRLGADAPRLLSAAVEAIRERHGLATHACLLVRRGGIERTASGKVRRRAVRDAFLADALDVVARWDAPGGAGLAAATSAEPAAAPPTTESAARASHTRRANPRGRAALVSFLRARVARLAGVEADDVDEHAPLSQYGLDSLNAAQLSQDIGDFLGVALSATISFDRPTIAALADALVSPATGIVASARRVEVEIPATHDNAFAIVGMSCRFPGAPDLERYWTLLEQARDAIGPVPPDRVQLASSQGSGIRFGGFLEGIDRFDANFFGISPREAARMDPQQRLFLELTWHALEDAGIPPSALRNSDAGVFAGIGSSEYALLHAGQLELIDADYGAGHAPSVIANRVSYAFDLRGPSLTVDTACSSALVALHLASQSLQSGECSLAIVGGVNVVLAPEPGVFLTKARTLARDGRCKTFDVRADGFVRSEGCGVLVLKRLRDAERAGDRIYAVVQGSAVNHDGASNGLMAPSGPAQERLLRSALARAGITPDQLDHVEAHGVGAPLSDAVELSALGRVLADRRATRPCWVSSVKTNLGHLEAASGIAGIIKTALALARERIPAHLHLQRVAMPAGLEQSALAIPTENVGWPRGARPRYGGVSAFGIGGTNAHVVLRESPLSQVPRRASDERPEQLLAVSAKDPGALCELARQLASKVEGATLSAVCYSANTGRDHFSYRAAVVAADAPGLRDALLQIEAAPPAIARRREPRLLFAFSERLPSAGAARELYAREPEFKRALDRGAFAAGCVLDVDLRTPLLEEAAPSARPLSAVDPNQPSLEFPQTSTVLLQYALNALLEHWRVRPTTVFGCGVGEYSAACVAGVMSWLDALRIVARRELLLASLVPGGRIRQTLRQFKTALASLEFGPAQLPLVASSSGRELRGDETLDQAYWLEHLYARTVPSRGLAELVEHRLELSLTLGPADSPCEAGADLVAPGDALSCLAGGGMDHAHLLRALGRLYERGCDIDWRAFHAGFERPRVDLPRYPFQRRRHWLDVPAGPRSEPVAPAARVHPFLARLRSPVDSAGTRGKTGKTG